MNIFKLRPSAMVVAGLATAAPAVAWMQPLAKSRLGSAGAKQLEQVDAAAPEKQSKKKQAIPGRINGWAHPPEYVPALRYPRTVPRVEAELKAKNPLNGLILEVYEESNQEGHMTHHLMAQVKASLRKYASGVEIVRMDQTDYQNLVVPEGGAPAGPNKPLIEMRTSSEGGKYEKYTGKQTAEDLIKWIHAKAATDFNLDAVLEVSRSMEDDKRARIYNQAIMRIEKDTDVYPSLVWRSPCGHEYVMSQLENMTFLPESERHAMAFDKCVRGEEYAHYWEQVANVANQESVNLGHAVENMA